MLFRSTFDGLGHTITNLYINRPSENYIGLFGGCGAAIIRNVGMVDVDITGNYQVGGLVAHTGGIISNAYTTGQVNSMTTIAGGLVGLSAGSVSNSYSTADVNGTDWVGGLVGVNWGAAASVTNSFSTGAVTGGGTQVGGLVGGNYNTGANPVVGSYWDTETSGRATSYGGTGKTTAEMKQQATFSGWDFVNTWDITEGVNYPVLVGLSGPTSPTPTPPAASSTEVSGVTGNTVATGNTVVALGTAGGVVTIETLDQGSSGNQEDDTSDENKKKDKSGEQKTYEKARGDKDKNFCN